MAQSAFIRKVNPWHQRLADWLIANGTEKGWNAKAAAEFGVTPAWISTVVHSDAFQDHYQSLNAQYSTALIHSVKDKVLGTADQALNEIQDRLDREGKTLPVATLLEVSDVMLKRAGVGEPAAPQSVVNVNVGLVTREQLAASREAMRTVPAAPQGKLLELEPVASNPPSREREKP